MLRLDNLASQTALRVMSHPGWPDLVRVGYKCAERMGDPYAHQREPATGTLIDSERNTVRDLLQRA